MSSFEDSNERLITAARDGDAEAVREALRQGADVNIVSQHLGGSALVVAASGGQLFSALGWPWQKYLQVMKVLIEAGADVNAQAWGGSTALMWSAEGGNADMARLLIEGDADVHVKDNGGHTALLLAARNGHVDVVRLLIGEGADIHARNRGGNTALMLAAASGKPDVARLLIEEGADVHARNHDGDTALMLAATDEPLTTGMRIAEAVREHGPVEITSGCPDVLKFLIGEGANIHARNKDGNTALMLAATVGSLRAARYLIGAGSDVRARNRSGKTALTLARERVLRRSSGA